MPNVVVESGEWTDFYSKKAYKYTEPDGTKHQSLLENVRSSEVRTSSQSGWIFYFRQKF